MNELSYDVVVIGSGIAGLAAALSAQESGARVAVVERTAASASGGNTRYTEAFLRMKSLDEAADDLAERLLDDFQGHPDPGLLVDTLAPRTEWDGPTATLNIVDHAYVSTLVEQAGPTLHWLSEFGVAFGALPTPFPTTSTTRMSPVGGGLALVEALTQAARRNGVDFHHERTARELVLDDGSVRGVATIGPAGPLLLTGQVVLACGGYEGNPEMLTRYHGGLGLLCRPVARGGHHNKGEGIEMALAVGAATAGNFALFHAEPIDPRSGEPEAAIFAFPYGILVNAEGRRFTDEAPGPADAWYERITRVIQAQPRGVAYLILDAEAQQVPNIRSSIRTDQPPIVGADLGELARRLDLPAATLQATVEAFNAGCRPGPFDHQAPDGLRTEGVEPPKSNWARPVAAGPYHAYPIMAANVFTFGGLRTDEQARVLDRDGRPIGGLFAAGEITGLYYSNYTGSTSVLRGAVFGRIGGRTAAVLREAAIWSADMTRIWHQSFTVLEDVGPYVEAMRRHLEARALPGTTIDFHGMRKGTYPSAYPGTHIGYGYLAGLHKEQFVAAALQAQHEGYDAFLIATVPDTGFEEIRSLLDIPVIAYGNASVAFAATLAPKIGIVNFIDALQPQLRRNMANYGFADLVGPIVSIGRGFDDIVAAYDDPRPLLDAFTTAARTAVDQGAHAIIPGEGPLNVFLADQGVARVHDVPVIDSLGVGIALCETRARMHHSTGLRPSRRGFYFQTPPADVIDSARAFYYPAAT